MLTSSSSSLSQSTTTFEGAFPSLAGLSLEYSIIYHQQLTGVADCEGRKKSFEILVVYLRGQFTGSGRPESETETRKEDDEWLGCAGTMLPTLEWLRKGVDKRSENRCASSFGKEGSFGNSEGAEQRFESICKISSEWGLFCTFSNDRRKVRIYLSFEIML